MDTLLGEVLRELESEVERAVDALEVKEVGRGSDFGDVGNGGGVGEERDGEETEEDVQRREACKTLFERWRRIGEVVEWALGVLQQG